MGVRNDTKDRMVTSAALMLREHGVTGTSFAKVLRSCGGPRGSIGFHFPGGKAQLGTKVPENLRRHADGGSAQPLAGISAGDALDHADNHAQIRIPDRRAAPFETRFALLRAALVRDMRIPLRLNTIARCGFTSSKPLSCRAGASPQAPHQTWPHEPPPVPVEHHHRHEWPGASRLLFHAPSIFPRASAHTKESRCRNLPHSSSRSC